MTKLFELAVNTPFGYQDIVLVEESGSYFEAERVIHDERTDGPIPPAIRDPILAAKAERAAASDALKGQ